MPDAVKVPKALDAITDLVLSYHPPPVSKAGKSRRRKQREVIGKNKNSKGTVR